MGTSARITRRRELAKLRSTLEREKSTWFAPAWGVVSQFGACGREEVLEAIKGGWMYLCDLDGRTIGLRVHHHRIVVHHDVGFCDWAQEAGGRLVDLRRGGLCRRKKRLGI